MSNIAALTPAEKRKITIAAKEEKARQEQVALEAEARGGRKAKNDANKNAIWKDVQKAPRKRTSSTVQVSDKPKKAKETQPADESEDEGLEPEPEMPATKASKAKPKRKYAAPTIAIDSDDSEPEVEKKSVHIDFTDLATFPVKSKAKTSKSSNAPEAASKAAKSKAVAKRAQLVPESASDSDDSEYESADGSGPNVAPSAKEFENEVRFPLRSLFPKSFTALQVPHVVSSKKAIKKVKGPIVISDDEAMPDAPPRGIANPKHAVDQLFDDDDDTADYIQEALKKAAAIKAGKARVAAQVSDDDSMPELAPVSDSDDDEDIHFHNAMSKALTTIPRSRRTSTASWSSGQDAIVPDTDIDEFRSDAESEKEGKVVTDHKKVRKVSAARQKKADLEVLNVVLALTSRSFILFYKQKPEVRPGVEVKKESVAITDVPARPESSWDMSARIAFPAPGKDIRLNDQTEEVKLVLRGGIKLIKTVLVIEDAYPPILSRSGLGKAYMVAATDNVPEAVHIKGRLLVDPKFAAMLSDILIDRVNIFRGAVKKVTVNIAPGHYKLAGLPPARTKQVIEDLLKDHRYIFPADPVSNRLQTELPFRHPAIVAVIKQGVFTGQFKANVEHLFVSTSKNHPKRVELPDPMVSLAATAIYAALVEYRLTGEHQNINFTEAAYEDTYRNHMKTLADTRTYAPVALHKVLHALYNDVTEARSVQPSASSSATLINLVDVPESD
ncbi:hypothetical protein DFH08DRAFT_944109 [Mycena albidolilacea]|uniref:DUF6532 domain-containing protein n=1 Tax=Mycena albidolilacea TaxID=1033008 RepID=A0AAD7ECF3_9AGAR|nr:hypothetical protein DFH08DRAFT_944109 [Mycena albidolilacea]